MDYFRKTVIFSFLSAFLYVGTQAGPKDDLIKWLSNNKTLIGGLGITAMGGYYAYRWYSASNSIKISHGVCALQGGRSAMEDYYHTCKSPDNRFTYFGIFDGHGGLEVAQKASETLHQELFNNLKELVSVPAALKTSFLNFDQKILEDLSIQSGTTASIVLFDHEASPKTFWVANIGDSEIVAGLKSGEASVLSELHQPKSSGEKERLEKLGADFEAPRVTIGDVEVVVEYLCAPKDLGKISVTRAFGDRTFKKPHCDDNYLLAEPFVQSYPCENIDFLIMASDGLWNVFTHQEAVDYVKGQFQSGKGLEEIAKNLSQEAVDRTKKREKRMFTDNVTVFVIKV